VDLIYNLLISLRGYLCLADTTEILIGKVS
jgi:hypothetical protein